MMSDSLKDYYLVRLKIKYGLDLEKDVEKYLNSINQSINQTTNQTTSVSGKCPRGSHTTVYCEKCGSFCCKRHVIKVCPDCCMSSGSDQIMELVKK